MSFVGAGIHYDVVRSQRGKKLILIEGYTFAKMRNYWTCSTRDPNCKAKLTLNTDGAIQQIYNIHCHPPRKFVKMDSGEYFLFNVNKNRY